MSFTEIFNAAFSKTQPQRISSATSAERFAVQSAREYGAQQKQSNNNGIPSFGIKGKAPLSQDAFEKSDKNQEKMISYKGNKLTLKEAQDKSYADVHRHEAAHLAAAGKYATTGICIDYDNNHIATSGHVGIAMPKLNKSNPKETIEQAEVVAKAAEAPASFDSLSGADIQVAAQARAVKAQALNLLA